MTSGRSGSAPMAAQYHVLFVCTGNTCRSPMAEAIFRQYLAGDPTFEVGSAGMSATPGTSCALETSMVLDKHQASLKGFRSRRVNRELLEQATHVFAMTHGHLDELEHRFPEFSDKFYLACEFVDLPDRGIGQDVPDPIGMGIHAYDEVANVLKQAVPTLVAYIKQAPRPESTRG